MPLPLPSSRQEIEKIQSRRKVKAVEQALRAPFHQRRLAGVDTTKLDDPREWAKIPILDKEELRALSPQAFMRDFNLASPRDTAEFWRSGGTTGVPLFYPRTFKDLEYSLLAFRRSLELIGLGPKDVAHVSFPLGIHPVGQTYCRVAQDLGVGVNWAGAGNSTPSALQIELIQRLQPTVWMGMSSYGIHLANLAESRGIDLASSSVRTVVCSAEPLSQAKRDKIERTWGAKVYDVFGMTEATLMGAEGEARDGFHIWTDMFVIEVLDPDSLEPVAEGEVGTLVVTPLWTHHATPFLRWSSGDLVTYRSQGASGGPFSVFPVVKHAHRTVGFFKVRGINLNHSELEDFLFRNAAINDFKCEAVNDGDLDVLRLSIEVRGTAEPEAVAAQVKGDIKATFELMPEVVLLERGTLAQEFERSLKAPRFADLRG